MTHHLLGVVGLWAALASGPALAADPLPASPVKVPMACSRGPAAAFEALVTMPPSAAPGALVTVRIDSVPSGTVSHFGLFSIHGMITHYLLPAGTSYVEGSARLLPDTGTANACPGAKVWHDEAGLHLALPAHVRNGSSYTPPSFEFTMRVDDAAHSELELQFAHYEVKADALLVGTVLTTCAPSPSPYTIARLRISTEGADAGRAP